MTLGDRLYGWRDRLLGSARFHRWAARFPPTRPIARRQALALFDLCAGAVYAQVLVACIELRLFELLADGPRATVDVAEQLGLPLDSAARLLGAATALRLVQRRGPDRFGLGLLGAASRGNPGIAAMVAHGSVLYGDLADPVALLRRAGSGTGLAAFWPYAGGGDASPASAVAPYTRLMAASQPLVAEQVLDGYPFRQHRSLLDVGGGDGTFLAAVARRAPDLRLELFDLPAVASLARERFTREGLDPRTKATGGDFHKDELPTGSDVATLIRVVHDHDDAAAAAILRAVYDALPPGGVLVVAEPMGGSRATHRMGEAYFAFYLMAMGSGRVRTAPELEALLRNAGFVAVRSVATSIPLLTGIIIGKRP